MSVIKKKFLIITGPTATGKTALAIKIASQFNGEIISSDSRHVYQGMDIGTGKDIPPNSPLVTSGNLSPHSKFRVGFRLKDNIPVWLVDIVPPSYLFNLSDFIRLAQIVRADIWSRNKLPVIVGGTGLYIKALINPLPLISVPPDFKLRKNLDKKDVEDIIKELIKIAPYRYQVMNASDRHNKRRLVRAIEIAKSTKKPSIYSLSPNWLMIYLVMDKGKLSKKVDQRVDQRLKEGIVAEIKRLLDHGFNFDLPSFSATPYRLFKDYFQKGQKENQLNSIIDGWKIEEARLVRKQLTWFKKMISQNPKEKILTLDAGKQDFLEKIEEEVHKWYTEN
ncbi:hypothetical protein A2W14_02275 [Candidatus Gottesmanbacteria bacterium RBG_16_37_8]|uniref:tRNA dimethylallyltransferase n=1 Tax=Candidatus Gottesmanbacteria bacterium RBG_16_37_8 TaxID=1798371 RepID=A0A1F5YR88_9BACT|nr:MAG: hypothetical protein A2W14_02275 [Candidatus Gottesmanbacteria bacterium RBG_16_37_8]